MLAVSRRVVLIVSSLLFIASTVLAAEDLATFDRRITAELRAAHPEAADLFEQANTAREAARLEEALGLYRRVRELAPDFAHATRRACQLEMALGHRDVALGLCREALDKERSAPNLVAFAQAMVAREKPDADEIRAAGTLASEALQVEPDNVQALLLECHLATLAEDRAALEESVTKLRQLAPEMTGTWIFSMVLAEVDGDIDAAEADLARARETGLPEAEYRRMLDELRGSRPLTSRILRPALWVLGAWAGVFVLLLVLGAMLSRATLRVAARPPGRVSGHVTGADAFVRHAYRVVIWASCFFYYLSIPVLVLLVLGTGGGLIYAAFAIGHIPIKLVVIIGVITLATLWSILKSLFVRRRDEDPGMRLPLSAHPQFVRVLGEVAARVGTRPVRTVFLTPGTEVAVFERGGFVKQLTGRTERCLILGAGVLPGFRLAPFKAVLAHEYGHFTNRDTAGGGLALVVRASMVAMAQHLARSGAANWYNPAWLFINGYFRVFQVVSQGASRLQEVLADRWAAVAYGAEGFAEGLRHVIERSAAFDAHVNATLNEVIESKQALVNLYTYRPAPSEERDKAVEAEIAEVFAAKASPYDSHPAPADRIAWVRSLPLDPAPARQEDPEAWTLFQDREALENAMTAEIARHVNMEFNVSVEVPALAQASS